MRTHTLKFEEKDRGRFNEIKEGFKKIETRAANAKYASIEEGDEILFTCGQDSFTKKVLKTYHWPTVEAMCAEVPLEEVMVGLFTVEQAKQRYATYPGYTERIKEGGILGFQIN